MPELVALTELLERAIPPFRSEASHAIEPGHPPAAVACAIVEGEVVHESAHGASPDGTRTSAKSVFDLASVTKIAATTLAVAGLVGRRDLALDAPVARWLPAFGARGKERVTVRELLGHRSGLPAWSPLFAGVRAQVGAGDFAGAREQIVRAVLDAPLERPGRRVYSDLGFIALGALVEAVSGARLDELVRDTLYAPRALDLGFAERSEVTVGRHLRAPASPPSPAGVGMPSRSGATNVITDRWLSDRHVLPTGRTRPREPAPGQEHLYRVPVQPERADAGHVDDDNAYAMGGVAGHAGLFGTARALAELGWLVADSMDGADRLGMGEVLRAFAAIDPADGPARGLGFDRPAAEGSSAGTLLGQAGPRGAIGHLGFTGCSLWIDRDRRLSVALLSNRTYPGRQHVEPIRALRPAFHDALCRALRSEAE